jgi:hypothetical protein
MDWKKDLETQTRSMFVSNCSPYNTKDIKVHYYYCNRGGEYKSKSNNLRQIKLKGTSKIGTQCSSFIKATQHTNSQHVDVSYCSTHYNHEHKLAHIRMPLSNRVEIASKLHQGVSMERILDDIKDSITK